MHSLTYLKQVTILTNQIKSSSDLTFELYRAHYRLVAVIMKSTPHSVVKKIQFEFRNYK